jgi:hypothetical protein
VIVTDVEASAGIIHAAMITVAGGVQIESSPVGTDAWRPSFTLAPIGAGPVPSAQIVLQGTEGWMVENDRTVIGGGRLQNGVWAPWTPPCSTSGGPVTITASGVDDLAALCDEHVYTNPPGADLVDF